MSSRIKLVIFSAFTATAVFINGCGTTNVVLNYPSSTSTQQQAEVLPASKPTTPEPILRLPSTTLNQINSLNTKDAFFTIPQWKVSFTLPSELSDLMYAEQIDDDYTGGSTIVFTTKSLLSAGGSGCDLGAGGGLGILVRTKKIPHPIIPLRARQVKDIHKIENYYYYYLPKSVMCSANDAGVRLESSQTDLLAGAIEKSLKLSE